MLSHIKESVSANKTEPGAFLSDALYSLRHPCGCAMARGLLAPQLPLPLEFLLYYEVLLRFYKSFGLLRSGILRYFQVTYQSYCLFAGPASHVFAQLSPSRNYFFRQSKSCMPHERVHKT